MTLPLHQRLMQRGFLAYSRFARGLTLGVRAVLLKDGGVLLVKHSYVNGWHFPGGGVESGESVADALEREIREEAGARLTAPPELFGVYRNAHADRRDHVVLFVGRAWERTPLSPSAEIVAAEIFPLDALPEDTSSGTRARLVEILEGAQPSADW